MIAGWTASGLVASNFSPNAFVIRNVTRTDLSLRPVFPSNFAPNDSNTATPFWGDTVILPSQEISLLTSNSVSLVNVPVTTSELFLFVVELEISLIRGGIRKGSFPISSCRTPGIHSISRELTCGSTKKGSETAEAEIFVLSTLLSAEKKN